MFPFNPVCFDFCTVKHVPIDSEMEYSTTMQTKQGGNVVVCVALVFPTEKSDSSTRDLRNYFLSISSKKKKKKADFISVFSLFKPREHRHPSVLSWLKQQYSHHVDNSKRKFYWKKGRKIDQ